MQEWKEFITFAEGHIMGTVLFIVVLVFVTMISYKNIVIVQKIYNGFTNLICFIRKEYILFANMSKLSANIEEIEKKYVQIGCKSYILKGYKKFKRDGLIELAELEKFNGIQKKKIKIAKSRMKNRDSFIYMGFPHIPFGFYNGYLFGDVDDVILYEFEGGKKEAKGKGFYELEKIYNTELEVYDTKEDFIDLKKAVAVKIEQSFPIDDNKIVDAVGDIQIIKIGIKKPDRWGISNYAQIDIYQKKFRELLESLNDCGVENIFLFATTPTSLSFSLGRVIKHYYPDITVYNYNNNKFNWCINLAKGNVTML